MTFLYTQSLKKKYIYNKYFYCKQKINSIKNLDTNYKIKTWLVYKSIEFILNSNKKLQHCRYV